MKNKLLPFLLCALCVSARGQSSTNKAMMLNNGTGGTTDNVLPPSEADFFSVNEALNQAALIAAGFPTGGAGGGNSNFFVAGNGVVLTATTGLTGTTNTLSLSVKTNNLDLSLTNGEASTARLLGGIYASNAVFTYSNLSQNVQISANGMTASNGANLEYSNNYATGDLTIAGQLTLDGGGVESLEAGLLDFYNNSDRGQFEFSGTSQGDGQGTVNAAKFFGWGFVPTNKDTRLLNLYGGLYASNAVYTFSNLLQNVQISANGMTASNGATLEASNNYSTGDLTINGNLSLVGGSLISSHLSKLDFFSGLTPGQYTFSSASVGDKLGNVIAGSFTGAGFVPTNNNAAQVAFLGGIYTSNQNVILSNQAQKVVISANSLVASNAGAMESSNNYATGDLTQEGMISAAGGALVLNGTGGFADFLNRVEPGAFSFDEISLGDALGSVNAGSFIGGGANLTGLNGGHITTGTVPSANLPAASTTSAGVIKIDGVTLTYNGGTGQLQANTTGSGTFPGLNPKQTDTNGAGFAEIKTRAAITNTEFYSNPSSGTTNEASAVFSLVEDAGYNWVGVGDAGQIDGSLDHQGNFYAAGTITSGGGAGNAFAGDGGAITGLNPANLTATPGTVPLGALPGNLPTLATFNGGLTTNLHSTNIVNNYPNVYWCSPDGDLTNFDPSIPQPFTAHCATNNLTWCFEQLTNTGGTIYMGYGTFLSPNAFNAGNVPSPDTPHRTNFLGTNQINLIGSGMPGFALGDTAKNTFSRTNFATILDGTLSFNRPNVLLRNFGVDCGPNVCTAINAGNPMDCVTIATVEQEFWTTNTVNENYKAYDIICLGDTISSPNHGFLAENVLHGDFGNIWCYKNEAGMVIKGWDVTLHGLHSYGHSAYALIIKDNDYACPGARDGLASAGVGGSGNIFCDGVVLGDLAAAGDTIGLEIDATEATQFYLANVSVVMSSMTGGSSTPVVLLQSAGGEPLAGVTVTMGTWNYTTGTINISKDGGTRADVLVNGATQ